jgi:hypothetical protein
MSATVHTTTCAFEATGFCTCGRSAATTPQPIQMENRSRKIALCPVCGWWISLDKPNHDRELHLIAALERIAAALEARPES